MEDKPRMERIKRVDTASELPEIGQRRTQARVSPLKDFVAGGFGGACLVIVGHPLDTVKVSGYHCELS